MADTLCPGTKLADEKAELQKKTNASTPAEDAETTGASPQQQPSSLMGMGLGLRRVTSPAGVTGVVRPDSPTLVGQIRQDLARAQQERADLASRLDVALRELETAKAKVKSDGKRIAQLTSAVSQLTTKLRDRDEELRGKAKLIENVQDENVTLNLQLNMADEQSAKLRQENKELVDRWMARMGREADQMNEVSKFG
jgi:chromosome segregation ATPase